MITPQELINREFQKRRAKNPNFSLRAYAKWLGLSPAQLSQMMAGKRTITLKSLTKISDRLGLSPLERKSVAASLLKKEPEANKKVIHLQEDQFRLIADWYHFAILSMTKLKNASSDPRWISRRLGISKEEAHQAVLRLERMGIIQTKPFFKQICDPIEALSSVPSQAIQKYHKQNLALASEKIETVPLNYREFQSISLTIDPKRIDLFKKHIDAYLEEMSELSNSFASNGSEVYNLNVQLFPVTTLKESST